MMIYLLKQVMFQIANGEITHLRGIMWYTIALIWDDVTYPHIDKLMGWFMALTDYDYGI